MAPFALKKEALETSENGNVSQELRNLLENSDSKKDALRKPEQTSGDAAGSPERPRRNAIKRKHYEELADVDDIIDDEPAPVSQKKATKPVAKITPVEAEKPKGKENTPTTTPEKTERAEPLASPGKGPKINFTFSKFTEHFLSNARSETTVPPVDASNKKKPKKSESSSAVNDRLCSLSCPGRKCSLPTLHCDVCLCLFHPECMGFMKGTPKAFTCNWCKKDQPPKDKADAEKKEQPVTVGETVVPRPPKLVPYTVEETEENDIASDDDEEFLPSPPEVVFSHHANHNVPVVPGIAFMRPPPPLTRAPIPLVNPVSQSLPIPRVVQASASPVPTQLVPPFGMASTTLRTMANLAQAFPKQLTAASPSQIILPKSQPPNIMANGPRPIAPGTKPANPLQVTVPGMTKGTLIYTNNPNLRFILTPSIPASTTNITTPLPPVPVAPPQTLVGEPKLAPSHQIALQPISTINLPPSTSKASLSHVTEPVIEASVPAIPPVPEKQLAPPPPPPAPLHVPDPEPIVIDIRETSLCDTMLKIKIPDPASGLKKATIILKKPETRERAAPPPKPKKRGRAKGTIMKKPDQTTEKQNEASASLSGSATDPSLPSTSEPQVATISALNETVASTPSGLLGAKSQSISSKPVSSIVAENQASTNGPEEAMDVTTQENQNKVFTEETGNENLEKMDESKEASAEASGSAKPQTEAANQNGQPLAEKASNATENKDSLEQNDVDGERPFSPLPAIFMEDDSDSDSVKSDYGRVASPCFPVILKEVTYDKSARIVTTCLSNRGARLTSPSANCARTLRYKRVLIDTGWSEEHTYSFSPKQPCLSSTRKTVMTLNVPRRAFHSLQSASDSLHLIFEYLNAQDLIRAGQVCRSWRKLATQPHLWKAVKLKGISVTDWSLCAKMLDRVKTTYLDLRGMKCKEDMWNQFVGTLHHLRNIEELVFGEVPAFVLTVVASSLRKLQCLEAEYIYTDVKRLPFWDPGCISSLQKLSILRLRAPKGLELPRFLSFGGCSAFCHLSYLTHLSLTSFRNSKSSDFEFLEKMPQLEVLEIGSCQDWDEKAYKRLVKLKSLCRLQLEQGGTAADRGLANALTYLSRLEDLTLIYFKITSSLAAAIRRLRNLWHLTLWPDMSSEGGLIVYNTLQAVRSLKKLQSFSWGIIYEDTSNTKYSRHASKYRESADVDAWWSDELRKTPHARGIRVPLLKALSESGKQQESKNEMQQGLIGVGHLHHKLKRVLPDSEVYIYQVPESLLTKVYGTLR